MIDDKLIVPDGKAALDYPDNSYKGKDAKSEKKVVAHGRKVVRKKSIRERISDWLFVDADDYEDFVYEDIIRPAVLDVIGDITHNVVNTVRDTIDTILFGSARGARRRYEYDRYYRTSYDDDRRPRDHDRRKSRDDDRRYSRRSDEVAAIVETRGEAVDLVHEMQERVHDYKVASVLNFYDMADMPTKSSDDNYGWDLGHPFEATITRTRDGYIVEPNSPVWLDR